MFFVNFVAKRKGNTMILKIAAPVLGAAAGYLYYRFVGCHGG